MIECERHSKMKLLEQQNKTKEQIYQKLKWIKCTCKKRLIWCDYCRGCAACLLCRNRDGTPRNDNYKYCPRCGGTGKCDFCNEIGETYK